MGRTLRRFSQPFTSNYSHLSSPGRMLNNDVSAFLRLQRHSPGSTSELKRTSHSNKAKIHPKNQVHICFFKCYLYTTRLGIDKILLHYIMLSEKNLSLSVRLYKRQNTSMLKLHHCGDVSLLCAFFLWWWCMSCFISESENRCIIRSSEQWVTGHCQVVEGRVKLFLW